MTEKKPNPTNLNLGYETQDLSIRGMVTFGIGLVIIIVITFVIIFFLFDFFSARQAAQSTPPPPLLQEANSLPPEPRLQRNPVQAMVQLRTTDQAVLNSYDWVDQQAGIVRIPITQAMELTLQKGLPVRPEAKNKGE